LLWAGVHTFYSCVLLDLHSLYWKKVLRSLVQCVASVVRVFT